MDEINQDLSVKLITSCNQLIAIAVDTSEAAENAATGRKSLNAAIIPPVQPKGTYI